MTDVTIEQLREAFQYNEETGELAWKERPVHHFVDARAQKIANTKYSGKSVGVKKAVRGEKENPYLVTKCFKKTLYVHRIVWALSHGYWPEGEIDHINGVKSDNRINNLRDVPHSENQKNMKRFVSNKSGVSGVCWDKREAKWKAYIQNGSGMLNIGHYSSLKDAAHARAKEERRLGFHKNHGRPVAVTARASA